MDSIGKKIVTAKSMATAAIPGRRVGIDSRDGHAMTGSCVFSGTPRSWNGCSRRGTSSAPM